MKNPIIFLDIDGVLNIRSNSYSTLAVEHNSRFADSICRMEYFLVKRLEYLVKMTDAKIVLISAWDLESAKKELKNNDFKYVKSIIDFIGYNENRIKAINDYVIKNKIKSFVIFDDEIRAGDLNALPSYERFRFIQIDFENGIQSRDISNAIGILNVDSEKIDSAAKILIENILKSHYLDPDFQKIINENIKDLLA